MLVLCSSVSDASKPNCRTVSYYDVREPHLTKLREAFDSYNWAVITDETNISNAYNALLVVLKWHIAEYIPARRVTLGSKSPSFVTPLIKSLLRCRNRLARRGQIQMAGSLSRKIGSLISERRATLFTNVNTQDTRKLWKAVNKSRNKNDSADNNSSFFDVSGCNKHFTAIATDQNYNKQDILSKLQEISSASISRTDSNPVPEYEIYRRLSEITRTSPGPDGIPYWLFKKCAVELAAVISHIINKSIISGIPPNSWKKAVITPVPKISNPKGFDDFRPISVTSILSRLAERLIVQRYVLPVLCNDGIIDDQFGFRPTGSTTSALVYLTHNVTRLLENNKYVRCLLIDFSKAFDTVNHAILLDKLAKLNIKPFIFNWIANFLTDRIQAVKYGKQLSEFFQITASIIQGSGIGPSMYATYAADLRTLSVLNLLFKYADDTSLLAPEHTDISLDDEFRHVLSWAHENRLKINNSKTKEIVFHQPNPRNFIKPDPILDIEQVISAKLLGFICSETLNPAEHVDFVLSMCNQRLYLLNQLKKQGLHINGLATVFQALVVSRISYALPAFYGFLSAHDTGRLNSLFKKALRWELTNELFEIETIAKAADSKLFKSLCNNSSHCLSVILPPHRPELVTARLRKRGHNFELPPKASNFHRKSFLVRNLYENI